MQPLPYPHCSPDVALKFVAPHCFGPLEHPTWASIPLKSVTQGLRELEPETSTAAAKGAMARIVFICRLNKFCNLDSGSSLNSFWNQTKDDFLNSCRFWPLISLVVN